MFRSQSQNNKERLALTNHQQSEETTLKLFKTLLEKQVKWLSHNTQEVSMKQNYYDKKKEHLVTSKKSTKKEKLNSKERKICDETLNKTNTRKAH